MWIYIASRPQSAQTWITQFNLQTTPCLPLAFVRVHQMAPPRTVVTTCNCSLRLIYGPRKDKRLSWPCWLTYSPLTCFTMLSVYAICVLHISNKCKVGLPDTVVSASTLRSFQHQFKTFLFQRSFIY